MGSLHLLTIAVAALAPLMPKVASIAAAAKPMVQYPLAGRMQIRWSWSARWGPSPPLKL